MRVLLAAIGLLALIACDDESTGPSDEGRLRVVHAVADVPLVDVHLGSTLVKEDLAYKAVSDQLVTGGSWAVKVRKADASADLLSHTHDVQPRRGYTVVAYGTEAEPRALALTDDGSPPASGKARIRVGHAAAGSGNVDVYVVKAVGDLANATAAATSIAPGAASSYLTVDADTYIVILTATGTKNPVLTVEGAALTAGKVQTLLAVAKTGGGTPLESIMLSDR